MSVAFLFTMPRSRTQWLTWLFRKFGVNAWHDPLSQCSNPMQLVHRIESYESRNDAPLVVIDTAAVFFHQQLTQALPHARRAYLIRYHREVVESIRRQTGRSAPRMEEQNERLFRYAYDADVLRIHYAMLDQEIGELWRFCALQPVPKELQVNYDRYLRRRVDVPMAQQPLDLAKTKALMRYLET